MSRYTVKQLARLSGVSVRTLHHYDAIGLLKPAFLGENRYRYYGREELLRTIDRTIAQLEGDGTMDDKDLYNGFAPQKQAEYEEWLVENYGDRMRQGIEASKAHWAGAGPEAMQAALAAGEAAEAELAARFHAGAATESMDLDPLFDRHRAWVSRMWGRECAREGYAGMADMYLAHPDFRTHFDERGEGFADWLTAAMKAYAARFAA